LNGFISWRLQEQGGSRKPQKVPGDPRRHPGDSRRPCPRRLQEALRCFWRRLQELQEGPGGQAARDCNFKRPQEAQAGPNRLGSSRPQEVPRRLQDYHRTL
jgi:hypothetical protein